MRELFSVLRAVEDRVRELRFEGGARRTIAHDPLCAWQVEPQEVLDALLDCYAPRVEEDRAIGPRLSLAWSEQRLVDAARPVRQIREPAFSEPPINRRSGHHDRMRGSVEPAQPAIAQRERETAARVDVFGKLRVIGGGERAAGGETVPARGEPERRLCLDMHSVWLEFLDHARNARPRSDGEANFRISGAGYRAKSGRRDQRDFVPERAELAHRVLDRGDDPVNLR